MIISQMERKFAVRLLSQPAICVERRGIAPLCQF